MSGKEDRGGMCEEKHITDHITSPIPGSTSNFLDFLSESLTLPDDHNL